MNKISNIETLSQEEKYWQSVYQELVQLIGKENTLILYRNYKGITLNFPMRLISSEGLEYIIKQEYDGTNAKEIAKKYDYSLRHVYRVIQNQKINNLE